MDMNQVIIAATMVAMGNHKNIDIDPKVVKHIALNSIRANNSKFTEDFGQLIICADDKNYWRRDVFPYYKAVRKENQKKSEINWTSIFAGLHELREDIIEHFPYPVLIIDKCEADDIIGTVVHEKGTILNSPNTEQILILSGDKDFIQLHKYANVQQYSPAEKKWVKNSNPEKYLLQHIIKGDQGDGIPNILMPDDTLVRRIRQRPITQKRLETWFNGDFTEEERKNFKRNESLIDLSKVPKGMQNLIMDRFDAIEPKPRNKMYKYMVKNRLVDLLEHINDF